MTSPEKIPTTPFTLRAAESMHGEPVLISMGKWNFYFLAKFALFWKGMIDFHALENLAFAAFILMPVRSPRLRIIKHIISTVIAVSLMYHDSWLPPMERVIAGMSIVANFDLMYLNELAGRIASLPILASIMIGWFVYVVVSARVRVGLLVLCSLIGLTAVQATQSNITPAPNPAPLAMAANPNPVEPTNRPDLNKALQDFYDKEALRTVSIPKAPAQSIPFDVIFIQVCSLSWDDVVAVGLELHPLWKRFDFLMTHFNSAAAYSGPAAVRIQRATCGQTNNEMLFKPVSDQCYLMRNLELSGFDYQLAMNHDGHFDDFLKLILAQNSAVKPMSLATTSIAQEGFDNSPIYDDLSVLTHWLDTRVKSNKERVALYYNTISLHDGNRLTGNRANLTSLNSYKLRLSTLLDNIEKFMEEIERSGRRAVVVVVPEHGAAVRGEQMQMAGLREIPSPKITSVPVGIKVVGGGALRKGDPLSIESESSYLAVSQLIANFIAQPPFASSGFDPADYAHNLPETPYVSQSDSAAVMKFNDRYYFKQGTGDWAEYK